MSYRNPDDDEPLFLCSLKEWREFALRYEIRVQKIAAYKKNRNFGFFECILNFVSPPGTDIDFGIVPNIDIALTREWFQRNYQLVQPTLVPVTIAHEDLISRHATILG